jgi:hypothetical protein
MDLFTSPLQDEEMLLRELALPSMEDIEIQKSDLTLATTPSEDWRMKTHIDTLRNS